MSMKSKPVKSLRVLSAGLCLSSLIFTAHSVQGATLYFGVASGISAGGTYSWDAANWSSSSSGPYTVNWASNTFAWFGASPSYTVTVNTNESMAGLFLDAAGNLTINDAGNNTGSLNISTNGGDDINNVDNSYFQGFLCSYSSGSANVIINAPVTGAGGIEQEGYGNLSLFGTNTFTGGTELTGGQNIYFNNPYAFGTGHIVIGAYSTDSALVNNTSSALTIANSFYFAEDGDSVILANAAGASTTYSGPVDLGASGTMTIQSSTGTNILSGVISDGANLVLINSSPLILSGANTYTGGTTLGGGTVLLGAANVIASSSGLTLDGGTLDPGGFNQSIGPVTLSANSTIDFEAGASELDFANSASTTWSGTLNLANWNPATDKLRFGTDATGLTAAQLQSFEFNGASAPTAQLDANGYLVIPQPITLLQPALSGTNLDFSLATTASQGYSVWGTTNLATPNWILVTNLTGNGATEQVALPITGPQQFFRVSQP